MVTLSDNDLYYLRSIKRQLDEVKEALPDTAAFSLGGTAFADNLDWLDCFIDKHTRAEQKRAVRWAQEQIAAAVEQSAFYYAGTGATKVVPSASGEMTTHVMAAYIRSLDLEEPRLTGRNTDHEQATTRDRNDDRDRPGYCDGKSRR